MLRILALSFIILLCQFELPLSASVAPAEVFSEVQKLYKDGRVQLALDKLKQVDAKAWSAKDQELRLFTMARWAQDLSLWLDSQAYLQTLKGKDYPKKAYVAYLLGHSFKETGDLKQARVEFKRALKQKPPALIKFNTRFELGEIAMVEKKWTEAYGHLNYLNRKWRNTPKHARVLWRLIKVEMERKRKWRACRFARTLYSRYPSNALIYDWSIDLHRSKYEGEALGCLASLGDQKSRIRRLQWAGESVRARKEIDQLRDRAKSSTQFEVDELLVGYLIMEGFVDEAVETLLRHHKKEKDSFTYLKLLGKAAARAGEFQTAVGAYYKASKLGKKSRRARKFLFRAAFLSYQFQDYDGAARKYQELIKKYPRSGLSRDARWHLAWIRYLRKDYKGAAQEFNYVLRQKKRRGRHWRKFSNEKIKYWLAMSYFRQEKYDLARPLLSELMSNRLIGYYSIAAQHRYNSIPGVDVIRDLASFDPKLLAAEEALEKLDAPPLAMPDAKNLKEEEESEEDIKISVDEDDKIEPVKAEESVLAAEKDSESSAKQKSSEESEFKNAKLAERFERANDFVRVGLNEWAKWELYEIERKTRNKDYLKMLVKAYEGIESFNRSSYIGEWYFAKERKQHGIDGIRYLWEYSYPQAYKQHVERFSGKFNVPKEFVWAIIRSESLYKSTAVSPVGAKGLMQLMPNTGRQVSRLLGEKSFQERDLVKPQLNIMLGTRYLNRLLKKFDGQITLAAAGYNAGPHRVESWLSSFGNLEMDEFIEHIPFIETRNYVKKVVRYYGIYRKLYGEASSRDLAWLTKPVPVKIKRRPATRETWELIQ